MKKMLICMLAALLALFGAAETAAPDAAAVLACFAAGEYDAVEEMLADEVRAAVNAEALRAAWEGQLAALGAPVSVEYMQQQGFSIAVLTHERGMQQLVVGADEAGKIVTLLLQPVAQPKQETPAPEGVAVRETKLFAGTERELAAEIAEPAGGCTTYAVLIHGSGPSDLNETVGVCTPFRDLAYDLAAQGVGSIRFDKMSYAHPELTLTLEDEYLDPVREALRVLKEETGAVRTVAVGHSQGGMLMPWLATECGFDAGVALAGTPKQLWEISWQQNLAVLETMTGAAREAAQAQIDAEYAKAQAMDSLGEDDTVFGLPVAYLREMAAHDAAAMAKAADMPMLFLWGDADFQVSESDFGAWRERLGEDERFAYIVYPGLNHLFMQAQEGDDVANAAAVYARGGRMDARVAQDIAAWLAK